MDAARGGRPTFQRTRDAGLAASARLFLDSELFSLDAVKHLRTDAWSPIFDCWTESQTSASAPIERFEVSWAPVWKHSDPLAGFTHGWDSDLLGSTGTVEMAGPDLRYLTLDLAVLDPGYGEGDDHERPRAARS